VDRREGKPARHASRFWKYTVSEIDKWMRNDKATQSPHRGMASDHSITGVERRSP
jgi:hypothetical protein